MATPSSAPAPPPPQDSDLNPDHHEPPSSSSSPSLSPPTPIPTLSNPDSPKPLQSISPPAKKTPPLPWSHQETVNLIQAYQEKWYSLKRGQLKSSQWEEVAITVAARCGYDEPSKTSTQCRHKIEKLRKRYRAEKQRPNPRAWEFFELMDSLERGPLPISARPMAPIQFHSSNPIHAGDDEDNGNADDDEEEANEATYNDTSKRNKSKSISHLLHGHMSANKPAMDRKLSGSGGGGDRVLQKQMLGNGKKRFERYESDGEEDDDDDEEEEEEDEEEEEEGEGGREVVLELAAEIKAFAERFVRMENEKVEMMRETLKGRMEMENKRMEMILESQQKIFDTIGRAFGSHKKLKIAQDI